MNENQILDKAVDILAGELNPKKILLFGSRAKGKNSKNADFDIAVDADAPDIREQRKLEEKLEEISGLHKIDIVYLGSVEDDFKRIVIKTGKVIYARGN
ncbi:MAG: nucleotidyltransferase domain-containing protein [Elusimicrobia bacterium HGW-Elusimicrobia-2]|nr:MAG: nucleotidyltransferase domain-containing protein [Elusimicrobia bacterium HGW-Elusimicrobia-2]